MHEYGLALTDLDEARDLDALILAVPHATYLREPERLTAAVVPGGVLMDVKSAIDRKSVSPSIRYWNL
jgi:UDP-N-acetyl-D-galactosamine dehydrogenase